METDVLFAELQGKDGAIGLVTLNRPTVLNSLNHDIIRAMLQQLTVWATASAIKAVVITGAGERAFCAGGDLRFTYDLHKTKNTAITAFFEDEYQLNSLIHHYPKPYIAFLDGITMGGGVGVSIHGSHRIATERLMFAMPETSIGLFPDVGGTYFLPRLPHHLGYYLGLTGARINADDSVALGIAQHKMASSSLDDFLHALADTSLTQQNAYNMVTAAIDKFATPANSSVLMQDASIIESCFKETSIEGIINKLAASQQPFLQKALDGLQKKSPTSLKVTLAALLKGATLSFDECMKQEYNLVSNFLRNHDFFEGIRAVIIDKDQLPQWKPATLADVSEHAVATYFLPVSDSAYI